MRMQQESVHELDGASSQTPAQAGSPARMTLALIIIAGFLEVIDSSIVQVALPME